MSTGSHLSELEHHPQFGRKRKRKGSTTTPTNTESSDPIPAPAEEESGDEEDMSRYALDDCEEEEEGER